jgi:hypothetical protein
MRFGGLVYLDEAFVNVSETFHKRLLNVPQKNQMFHALKTGGKSSLKHTLNIKNRKIECLFFVLVQTEPIKIDQSRLLRNVIFLLDFR